MSQTNREKLDFYQLDELFQIITSVRHEQNGSGDVQLAKILHTLTLQITLLVDELKNVKQLIEGESLVSSE